LLKAVLRRFPSLDKDENMHVIFDCRRLRDPAGPADGIRSHLGYHPQILDQVARHNEMRYIVNSLQEHMQEMFDRGNDREVLDLIFVCNHSRHRSIAAAWLVYALLREMGAEIVKFQTTPSPRACLDMKAEQISNLC
jgi:RNase adaptor protein for sRNA GlmZ degradation